MKASLYIYSTPKYRANMVKTNTRIEDIKASISIQKTRCMSTMSKQKNHLPKSTKKYVPVNKTKYNSLSVNTSTVVKVSMEP
jgi:hypothetical protein